MNRMTVALFANRAGAEPIQQRLRRSGVAAEIREQSAWEKFWFISRKSAGARLEVPANEFERGEELLLDWDAAEGALRDAIRCPECRSLRIDYPQFTRKSVLTNLAMGLAAELGLVEKDYYCKDCHFTWPKEGSRPRRNGPHMAPYYFIEGIEQTNRPGQQAPPKPEPGSDQQRKAA